MDGELGALGYGHSEGIEGIDGLMRSVGRKPRVLMRGEGRERPASIRMESMEEVEGWDEEGMEGGREVGGRERRLGGMECGRLPSIVEEEIMDEVQEMEEMEEVEELSSTPSDSNSTPLDTSLDSIDVPSPTSTNASSSYPSPASSLDETFEPISSRPISSLLHIFSYRATVCLSSLELLPSDSLPSSLWQEPSLGEKEVVHHRLKDEVEIVERAIERAVEDRGVSVEVKRGQRSYFATMRSSFVDVRVDEEGIDTVLFLDAVESLVVMFGESSI